MNLFRRNWTDTKGLKGLENEGAHRLHVLANRLT